MLLYVIKERGLFFAVCYIDVIKFDVGRNTTRYSIPNDTLNLLPRQIMDVEEKFGQAIIYPKAVGKNRMFNFPFFNEEGTPSIRGGEFANRRVNGVCIPYPINEDSTPCVFD